MLEYEIRFKSSVEKDLKKIPQKDQIKILTKIDTLRNNPKPVGSTKLTNQNYFRIRQGNYRIIYEVIENKILIIILRVRHRKDVYKN